MNRSMLFLLPELLRVLLTIRFPSRVQPFGRSGKDQIRSEFQPTQTSAPFATTELTFRPFALLRRLKLDPVFSRSSKADRVRSSRNRKRIPRKAYLRGKSSLRKNSSGEDTCFSPHINPAKSTGGFEQPFPLIGWFRRSKSSAWRTGLRAWSARREPGRGSNHPQESPGPGAR